MRQHWIHGLGCLLLIATEAGAQYHLTNEKFLEMIAQKTFNYFWQEANPENGLIPDATNNSNASISVVGFGLAGLCLAEQRDWITRQEAYARALTTLQSFIAYPGNPSPIQVEAEHGHHYHWIQIPTGKWIGTEGIYASDTAAFIAGVLTVGNHFAGTEVEQLANQIYAQVDWTWFYHEKENGIYVGWEPHTGYGGIYGESEIGTLFAILAIASPTHPIPVRAWFGLGSRYYWAHYRDYKYVGDGAAYTHQWPFCFIDPRLKKDYFLDYFQNLREFALASRQWCQDNSAQGYSDTIWGLNVAMGPDKYGDYAAPVIPGAPLCYNGRDNDGTVAPTAALSFMPFTPAESLATAKFFYDQLGQRLFGPYGFTDTFNLKKRFYSQVYLGIDQGPIMIMIDNYLHATVWDAFSHHPAIQRALDQVGFVGIVDTMDSSPHSPPYAQWNAQKGKAQCSLEPKQYKEGQYALRILWPNRDVAETVLARPQRTDFSDYNYLSYWLAGEEVDLSLQDKTSQPQPLPRSATLYDGDWRLVFHDLKSVQLDRRAITGLLFKAASPPQPIRKTTYLDFIHLTNLSPDALAAEPINFQCQPGDYRGEVRVSWNLTDIQPGQVPWVMGTIKRSFHPIKNAQDFARAETVAQINIAALPADQNGYIISNIAPGQKIYLGMQCMNSRYQHSRLFMNQTIVNDQTEPAFVLGPRGKANLDPLAWYSFTSAGDQIQVEKISEPSQALLLNYSLSGGMGHGWFGIGQKHEGRLLKGSRFVLRIKNPAPDLGMEFKIIDVSGAVFGLRMAKIPGAGARRMLTLAAKDLNYWWSGRKASNLGPAAAVEIVFTASGQTQGKIVVEELKLITP